MTKATTHFFLVIIHNHRQFSFFSHNISVDASSIVSHCFPSFSSFSQKCSMLIAPSADGGEKKDSTKWSYSCSLLGGKWEGMQIRWENVFFFFHFEAKSFKRCPSLKRLAAGRSLGRDQGHTASTGSTGARSAEEPENCWR